MYIQLYSLIRVIGNVMVTLTNGSQVQFFFNEAFGIIISKMHSVILFKDLAQLEKVNS